jgi:hypothetical protein
VASIGVAKLDRDGAETFRWFDFLFSIDSPEFATIGKVLENSTINIPVDGLAAAFSKKSRLLAPVAGLTFGGVLCMADSDSGRARP